MGDPDDNASEGEKNLSNSFDKWEEDSADSLNRREKDLADSSNKGEDSPEEKRRHPNNHVGIGDTDAEFPREPRRKGQNKKEDMRSREHNETSRGYRGEPDHETPRGRRDNRP